MTMHLFNTAARPLVWALTLMALWSSGKATAQDVERGRWDRRGALINNRGTAVYQLIAPETATYEINLKAKFVDVRLSVVRSNGTAVSTSGLEPAREAALSVPLLRGESAFVLAETARLRDDTHDRTGEFTLSTSLGGFGPCMLPYDEDGEGLPLLCAPFGGSGSVAKLTGDQGNDNYQQILMPAGLSARLFVDDNFQGTAATLFQGRYSISPNMRETTSVKLTDFNARDFSMVVISDPQYPRTHCSSPADGRPRAICDMESAETERWELSFNSEGTVDRDSQREASRYYNLVTSFWVELIAQLIGDDQFAGVIVNGDLTEFGDHDTELVPGETDLDQYRQHWDFERGYNVYVGLGNHDYEENVDDCQPLGIVNRCVYRMFEFADSRTRRLGLLTDIRRREDGEVNPTFEGSGSYSFDIGRVHFVQLQNYASYRTQITLDPPAPLPAAARWEVHKSFPDGESPLHGDSSWLRKDLERATARGQTIVINVHDTRDFRGATDHPALQDLLDLIAEYPVSAIFAGHIHQSFGQIDRVRETVPVFRSGAAFDGSMLVTRFTEDRLYVYPLQADFLVTDRGTLEFPENALHNHQLFLSRNGYREINLRDSNLLDNAIRYSRTGDALPSNSNNATVLPLQNLFQDCDGDPNCIPPNVMSFPLRFADADRDGVPDWDDNCTEEPNENQRDTDGDGFGNRCDPDLNNDNRVDLLDMQVMRSSLFKPVNGGESDHSDLTGDGVVNYSDLAILRAFLGRDFNSKDDRPSPSEPH